MSQTVNSVGHELAQWMSSEASDVYPELETCLHATETVALSTKITSVVPFTTSDVSAAPRLSQRAAKVAAVPLQFRRDAFI